MGLRIRVSLERACFARKGVQGLLAWGGLGVYGLGVQSARKSVRHGLARKGVQGLLDFRVFWISGSRSQGHSRVSPARAFKGLACKGVQGLAREGASLERAGVSPARVIQGLARKGIFARKGRGLAREGVFARKGIGGSRLGSCGRLFFARKGIQGLLDSGFKRGLAGGFACNFQP